MPTLKELLENDLGVSMNKTASAKSQDSSDEAIEKLAAEYGLDFDKSAEDEKEEKKESADHEDSESEDEEQEEHKGTKKEASAMDMSNIYGELFPDDAAVFGSEKTAQEEKTAAEIEEAMGAGAYDEFSDRFAIRMEKMASDLIEKVSDEESLSDAVEAPGQLPNDHAQRAHGGKAINANDVVVTDEIKKTDDARTVGHYEQKVAAAMRRQLLLSELED